MRIHLRTTPNVEIVPFDYQQKLTGILHKWLGKCNDVHDSLSLYSFSWLSHGRMENAGLSFPEGAYWFISFYNEDKIKLIIRTILEDPYMFSGMSVTDVTIEETPDLSGQEVFRLASPIFIQRYTDDGSKKREKQYTFNDADANRFLKETLQHKMSVAGLEEDETLSVTFDLSYAKKKTKLMTYKGIHSKASLCPIIIKGKPETKAFAWNVGIGNCTGIGFGSIF
jgi:CRISPR-associated endoribonuclease Cas6